MDGFEDRDKIITCITLRNILTSTDQTDDQKIDALELISLTEEIVERSGGFKTIFKRLKIPNDETQVA